MNLALIFSTILAAAAQNPQGLISVIQPWINMYMASTAKTVIAIPAVLPGGAPLTRGPMEEIRVLQHLLNQALKPNPPLDEDGWLGSKTRAAILQGAEKLQPYLALLGGR
jgi:hypothetical protein